MNLIDFIKNRFTADQSCSRTAEKGEWARAGFTLIEVLVGSVIASIILLMLYSSYNSTLSLIRKLSGYAEFYENVNLAIKKIDSDFSNTYFKKENSQSYFVGNVAEKNSRVYFVSVSHTDFDINGDIRRPNPVSDVRAVSYYLMKDKDFDGLYYLIKKEKNHYDKKFESGGEQNVLLKNVTGLRVRYRQGNDWTDKWDSRQNSLIPEAVQTVLSMKTYEGKEELFTFTSLVNINPSKPKQ